MQKSYLHILCPPVWEKLPSLGIAYLLQSTKNGVDLVKFYDLNNLLFNAANPDTQRCWTINPLHKEKEFFDYFFQNHFSYFENLLNLIEKIKPSYIGFSIFNINKIFTLNIICFIKKHFPDIKIISGGPETFSFYINNFKKLPDVDYVVVGEGEKPLYEILSGKSNKKVFLFEELDKINFYPEFKEFDLNLYPRKNSLPIIFGRGCINKCNFCSERLLYKRYKISDVNLTISAMDFYIKKYGIKWLTFYDSMLNANLTAFEGLLDKIVENKFNIIWDAQLSIRKDMEERIFHKMKESGCINLFIGLESGSNSLLKRMGKNFDTEEAKQFFEKLNKAGLQFEVSLIIGYPEETEKEFEETLTFLKKNVKLIPKIAQVSIFRNYPGISARKNTKEEEKVALKRLEKLINFLEILKINYTKSYVNNLI